MPSGNKKRKSAKWKNKASASPHNQSWLPSHMQMLKASSFGIETNDKEKHDVPENEAAGNGDREKEEQHIFFEFKGGETACACEMDASGNEDSQVSAIATAEIPSEAENSQKLDLMKILALDKSDDQLQENDKSELFEFYGFSEESVTSDINVGWTGGLETNGREDNDTKGVEVGNSSEEVITSRVKEYVPEAVVGGEAQASVKKEEVRVAHAMDASAWEKKNKAMKDAHWSLEATQDDEKVANTAKTEHASTARRSPSSPFDLYMRALHEGLLLPSISAREPHIRICLVGHDFTSFEWLNPALHVAMMSLPPPTRVQRRIRLRDTHESFGCFAFSHKQAAL